MNASVPQTAPKPVRPRVEHAGRKTIVLFSEDIDFCVSLQLLLEDRYRILTTTDADMLVLLVKSFSADLVVADALPSDRMRRRFEVLKRISPALAVVMFYVSYPENNRYREMFRSTVDALFAKPLDLSAVVKRIDALMRKELC